jgi:hypothetical protein
MNMFHVVEQNLKYRVIVVSSALKVINVNNLSPTSINSDLSTLRRKNANYAFNHIMVHFLDLSLVTVLKYFL